MSGENGVPEAFATYVVDLHSHLSRTKTSHNAHTYTSRWFRFLVGYWVYVFLNFRISVR